MAAAVCIVIFVVVSLSVMATAQRRASKLGNAYHALARRYHGRFQTGGWFSHPKAHFIYQGTSVTVDLYSTGGKHPTYYTQARFTWQPTSVRVEVYPTGPWSQLGSLVGMQDIVLDDPQFDERYVIKSNDAEAARSLLTPAVCWSIDQLYQMLGNRDIYISFVHGSLLVKKRSLISRPETLAEFVRLSVGLYDQAMLTLAKGIEFTDDSDLPEPNQTVCQICGDPIITEIVVCRCCRTPHHADCWQYYGACSTYGCQETFCHRVPGRVRRQISTGQIGHAPRDETGVD